MHLRTRKEMSAVPAHWELANKIVELRERAKSSLGARFDIRAFHDTVLGNGPLPLPILEQTIDAWVAGGGKPASA